MPSPKRRKSKPAPQPAAEAEPQTEINMDTATVTFLKGISEAYETRKQDTETPNKQPIVLVHSVRRPIRTPKPQGKP